MTLEEMIAVFKEIGDEYLEFDRVEHKLSARPDLHAFLLLDQLVPDAQDMVCAAEHDVVYLQPDATELANKLTRQQIIDLCRCGVRYSSEHECLCMFV